jgi:hypothetical protein
MALYIHESSIETSAISYAGSTLRLQILNEGHIPSLKTMVDLFIQLESPVLLVYSADGSLSPAKTKLIWVCVEVAWMGNYNARYGSALTAEMHSSIRNCWWCL